ncbi:MAG: glutathione S-transferase family protein [Gemmatimonadetes bacterium]|nr:glutathione S-transferase family protein [Gemmatimonadota bacterium]
MRLYRYPLSTNVERVALALAHKRLAVESVVIDPADRSEVRRISGQDLVPVLDDGGRVVFDSMEIVRHLDERYPDRPLYPRDPARRAEMLVFIEWFNRVWKRPPNDMEAELGKPQPDRELVARWGQAMRDWLGVFEDMLNGRDYLMGDELSAADIAAFPFLKYGLDGEQQLCRDEDPHLFHRLLVDHQPVLPDHPRLAEWIRRLDELPRA